MLDLCPRLLLALPHCLCVGANGCAFLPGWIFCCHCSHHACSRDVIRAGVEAQFCHWLRLGVDAVWLLLPCDGYVVSIAFLACRVVECALASPREWSCVGQRILAAVMVVVWLSDRPDSFCLFLWATRCFLVLSGSATTIDHACPFGPARACGVRFVTDTYPATLTEEDYKNSINKGFRGPPFVKSAPADQH